MRIALNFLICRNGSEAFIITRHPAHDTSFAHEPIDLPFEQIERNHPRKTRLSGVFSRRSRSSRLVVNVASCIRRFLPERFGRIARRPSIAGFRFI